MDKADQGALEAMLAQPPPFVNSSVPADAGQAQRYALRLENRYKADQLERQQALTHLDSAHLTLSEALAGRRVSRQILLQSLGQVQMARETLA